MLRTSLTFSSFERNCWQGRLSVASWVDTWQGSGNSTLTVLRIAARNVRWILFAGEPTYRGSGSCEMFADVLCVRGQLCKRLRNAARKPPKVDDAVAEQASLLQRLRAVWWTMHATTVRRTPLPKTLSLLLVHTRRILAVSVDSRCSRRWEMQFGVAHSEFEASSSASYRFLVPLIDNS